MTTYIAGPQHTLDPNQLQRKLEIHPEIIYLEEDLSPLVILTWGKGKNGLPIKKKRVGNPKYYVLEKTPHEEWTAINYTTGYTAADTTFVCDITENISVGMLVQDVSSGEVMYVNAKNDGANTITVNRSVGPTAAGTIDDDTPLKLLSFISPEYAQNPVINRVKVRDRASYTQIIREPLGLSGTLNESDSVGPEFRGDLRKESWLEWRKRVERIWLHSEPFEDTSVIDQDGNPARATGGAIYWCKQAGNVTSVATTLTKAVWLTFSRNLFKYGKNRKVVLCSPLVIEALDSWKDNKLEMRPSEEFFNIRVVEWTTGQGTMVIMKDNELNDSPYGSGGFGGACIGLDPANFETVYLNNRDVHLRTNIQERARDGFVDEIFAEIGVRVKLPETMWMLDSIEEYS